MREVTTDPDATLESLRESVTCIQLQPAVIVEWIETLDGRFDAFDGRLERGY